MPDYPTREEMDRWVEAGWKYCGGNCWTSGDGTDFVTSACIRLIEEWFKDHAA